MIERILDSAFVGLMLGTSVALVLAAGWWLIEFVGVGPFWFVAAFITVSTLAGFLAGLTEPNERRRPRAHLDRRP